MYFLGLPANDVTISVVVSGSIVLSKNVVGLVEVVTGI